METKGEDRLSSSGTLWNRHIYWRFHSNSLQMHLAGFYPWLIKCDSLLQQRRQTELFLIHQKMFESRLFFSSISWLIRGAQIPSVIHTCYCDRAGTESFPYVPFKWHLRYRGVALLIAAMSAKRQKVSSTTLNKSTEDIKAYRWSCLTLGTKHHRV